MRRWKQQEIPCLENDDGQFRLAKCCSMLPTNRATMQEYQSSGIILCLHITGASKASISGVQLVTREDARRKGWKTSPCISLSCPKINLCLVSKTFNISDATWLMRRRLGRHEGHVKISVFVVQTPCHDGILKPKFLLFFPPSAIFIILHHHSSLPSLHNGTKTTWRWLSRGSGHIDDVFGLPGATSVLVLSGKTTLQRSLFVTTHH